MKSLAWGAAAAALAVSAAGAQESLRTTQGVACARDGTNCTRFQSYVYVRRESEAPVRSSSGASATRFGERRVYLNMGAAEAR